MNNESPSFQETVSSVGSDSQIPESRGAFEKQPAQQSLVEMQSAGQQAIEAQNVANVATRELNEIQGVSPEVSAIARKALESSLESLNKKAVASKRRGGFWGGVRNLLGKDPSVRDNMVANQQLDAAVGVIRSTGEVGRSMNSESRNFNETQRNKELNKLEKTSRERRLGLREKVYNFANEKASKAMATHGQLENAIAGIKAQIDSTMGVVDANLQAGIQPRMEVSQQAQSNLQEKQAQFARATQSAEDANYTGYTNPVDISQ